MTLRRVPNQRPPTAPAPPDPWDRIEALLRQLIALTAAEQQQGIVLAISPTVTSTSESNRIDLNVQCFSLTIINDGANTVEIKVPFNAGTPFQQLLNGEQVTFTARTARFRDFAARVQTAGNSAALRVFALI